MRVATDHLSYVTLRKLHHESWSLEGPRFYIQDRNVHACYDMPAQTKVNLTPQWSRSVCAGALSAALTMTRMAPSHRFQVKFRHGLVRLGVQGTEP